MNTPRRLRITIIHFGRDKMAYTNVYPNRINWENEPSINTPINETNLNKMDYALYQHDRTLENWDTTKANQSDLLLSVKTIEYDDETGTFVFTWQNGTTKTVDLNIEKIPVSFSMSPQGVITMTTDDGTTYTADVGALIKTYTFTDSSVIDFTVTTDASGNKTITADIVDGSINGNKLQPNYLADCTAAKTAAENAEDNAEDSAEDAEAWAVGERNGVPVDPSDPTYHNNSKYWSQQANPTTLEGLTDTDINDPEDGQVLTFNGVSEKWENADPAAGGGSKVEVSTSEVSLIGTTATLTDGTTTLSAEFDAGGKATFMGVTMTGDLTLTATDGVDTITRTISIPYFGNYSVVVAFFSATVNVTFPFSSGATCILSDGVTTLNATASPMAFNVPNAGTWTTTVTLDGVSKQDSATITTDGQTESITIEYGTINLTFDNEFRGLNVTCVNGGVTITKQAPISGNTMAFYPPSTGEWIISSTYSGVSYSTSATVVSLSTAVSAILQTLPNGQTVLPTDDIQTWLKCAGITNKTSYTTLADVLGDSTTLLALMSSNNAVDYLVRSKSWATANGLVPEMTSATTPSGEVSQSTEGYYGGQTYGGWTAFNSTNPSGWMSTEADTTPYIQYNFEHPVAVRKIHTKGIGHSASQTVSGIVQGSNDNGATFVNIPNANISVTWGNTESDFAIPFYDEYEIIRIQFSGHTYYGSGLKLQFYSTSEAQGICDNSTAMTDIGANDYCAETLLADSTWCDAICNSTYFESVLNVKVPTMTSDTAPSGIVTANNYTSGLEPYRVFSSNPITTQGWSSMTHTNGWVAYEFVASVCINKIDIAPWSDGTYGGVKDFEIQGYNGGTWESIYSDTVPNTTTPNHNYFSFANNTSYSKIRLYISNSYRPSSDANIILNKLQFYGRSSS